MPTATDVAAAILEESGPLELSKLHALLYYTQGWTLAWTGRPMFEDEIEAWEIGPVVTVVQELFESKDWHDLVSLEDLGIPTQVKA